MCHNTWVQRFILCCLPETIQEVQLNADVFPIAIWTVWTQVCVLGMKGNKLTESNAIARPTNVSQHLSSTLHPLLPPWNHSRGATECRRLSYRNRDCVNPSLCFGDDRKQTYCIKRHCKANRCVTTSECNVTSSAASLKPFKRCNQMQTSVLSQNGQCEPKFVFWGW